MTESVVFRFDDEHRITRVTTERYRQEDNTHVSWTGYFCGYEERHGILIPTEAAVEWNSPDGDLPYWRATIEEITYRTT